MWRLWSNRSPAAKPEFSTLVFLGSPPQGKPPAHREREHTLKKKCWYQGGMQDGVWVGTWGEETHPGGCWAVSWASGGTLWSREFMHKRPDVNPSQIECRGSPCRRKAEWPSPAVYIAYWTWLSAVCDIFIGHDSAKVLLKERKQPKERSLSIALIISWRVVKGPTWALPWWMGQQ